jgi:NAD(P)-dependent dehydrogenase (short-subunit alcohol dehydrogenase family)
VAVVVGGSSGIGKAISLKLSSAGASLILVSRDLNKLNQVARSLPGDTYIVSGDISCPAECTRVAQEIGKMISCIDHIVFSSGIFDMNDLQNLTEDHWDRVMNSNLKGPVFLTQALLPLIIAGNAKSIVFISSILAHIGDKSCLAYCASKAAISSIVRVMALELAHYGIRVNAISPGHVQTPMISSLLSDSGNLMEIKNKYPLGRIGSPEDVANFVLFLLSKESSWITGMDYIIDGGRSAQG